SRRPDARHARRRDRRRRHCDSAVDRQEGCGERIMARHGRCAAALSHLTVRTTGGAVAPPPRLQTSANAMHDRSGSKFEELTLSKTSPLCPRKADLGSPAITAHPVLWSGEWLS